MADFLDPARWTGRIYSGDWLTTGRTTPTTEPATGETLGQVGTVDAAGVHTAAEHAARAQPKWAACTYIERSNVLRRAADILQQHLEEIREWLIRESGSTRAKTDVELAQSVEELREAAALPLQPIGQLLPTIQEDRQSLVRRVPRGVVAVIAPWNFPLLLALRSVAPALAVGNSVLLKPASETAVCCGVVIARLFEEAGLPPGVLHMLPGKGSELGEAFATDPNVDLISFTGSTAVGKKLAEAAGREVKQVVLELGGNNPLIVLEDADPKIAAAAGAFGSFFHQGQICMGTGRHLVAEPIADAYVKALTDHAQHLTVGDPREDVQIGPIINEDQAAHIDDVISRSVQAGARVVTGGTRDGLFYRPTVLVGVTAEMAAYTEEIFGPVAPVTTFKTDEEAIALANGTEYGLVAAVQSASPARAMAVADRLKVGMVHINDQTVNDEAIAPFGGAKASGEGGRFGGFANLDAFTTWQWVTRREAPAAPLM
jgi:benzaldehyde dehydrogenase (NAD)